MFLLAVLAPRELLRQKIYMTRNLNWYFSTRSTRTQILILLMKRMVQLASNVVVLQRKLFGDIDLIGEVIVAPAFLHGIQISQWMTSKGFILHVVALVVASCAQGQILCM